MEFAELQLNLLAEMLEVSIDDVGALLACGCVVILQVIIILILLQLANENVNSEETPKAFIPEENQDGVERRKSLCQIISSYLDICGQGHGRNIIENENSILLNSHVNVQPTENEIKTFANLFKISEDKTRTIISCTKATVCHWVINILLSIFKNKRLERCNDDEKQGVKTTGREIFPKESFSMKNELHGVDSEQVPLTLGVPLNARRVPPVQNKSLDISANDYKDAIPVEERISRKRFRKNTDNCRKEASKKKQKSKRGNEPTLRHPLGLPKNPYSAAQANGLVEQLGESRDSDYAVRSTQDTKRPRYLKRCILEDREKKRVVKR